MPERAFPTDTWGEDWFQPLTWTQRYLYMYLESNGHCNPAGVYRITLETMAFESKIPIEELPKLLESMSIIRWDREKNIVWVKRFIERQWKSPKFLIAAGHCLEEIGDPSLTLQVIQYNSEIGVSIPLDTVSKGIDTSSNTDTGSSTKVGKKEVVKGKEKEIPRSRTEIDETLCEGDLKVISVWRSVKGFAMIPADESALVAKLRTEFSELDILAESKAWAARKLSEPLKRESKPSSQIWNWIRKAREFKGRSNGTGSVGAQAPQRNPQGKPDYEGSIQRFHERHG